MSTEDVRPEKGADDGRPEAPPRRRPGSGARLARRAGAAVAALGLLGATAAVVLADEVTPAPAGRPVPAPPVGVPATVTALSCGGQPELAAGRGMSVDPDLEPEDVEPTTVVRALTLPREEAGPATATYGALDGERTELTATGQVRLHEAEVTDPGALLAEPGDGAPALAAGASVTRTAAGDLRGLLGTPCLAPTTTTWLVGGSTAPGASAELVLSNLGQTPATVDVTGWGSLGELGAASGILVAPMSQERVLVEAAVGTDPRPALRVTASGGQVAATVQAHEMNGLVSAGLETLTPAAAPAQEVTVPGVVLAEDAAGSVVRVLNPGTEPATVDLSLLGTGGEEPLGGAQDLVVDPGAVVDVDLDGVEPGAYAAHVSADVPVTAGAVVTRTGQPGELDPDTPPVDRAWSAAADPLTDGILTVPGPLADTATVALANPGDTTMTVWLRPVTEEPGAGETMVEVPARGTARLDVAELGEDVLAVQVAVNQNGGGAASDDSTPRGVVAALVLTAEAADGELVTVLPATEDPDEAGEVRVSLR